MKTKLVGVLILLALTVVPAFAAYNMVLTGPGLKGEVTDREHRDGVGLVALKMSNKTGGSGPLVIEKNLDAASNTLFAACLDGTVYPSLVIDVMKPVGGSMMVVTKITLGKATVKNVELKYESALIEEVTLAYETISWNNIELHPDGSKSGESTQGWDNRAGAKL
ncbi:MAG: type VI secretion system tube protein Hcp [Candidatus Margulisbacteria bacterium]|nr:type VI secretion system tube protein Hcp [Candidatus Margulisiibacteriota bacterium]